METTSRWRCYLEKCSWTVREIYQLEPWGQGSFKWGRYW
jgi:hypothetical protein